MLNASPDKLTIITCMKRCDTVVKEPDFRGVDIEIATEALDLFWERNKNRISNNLMVEKGFIVKLGGFTFKGFIDRVDPLPGANDEVEIIWSR